MKKSEIFLLFFTLALFVTLLIIFVSYYIKPSIPDLDIEEDRSYVKQNIEQIELNNDWISKISNKNNDFTYPTVIFHTKF